MKHYRTPRGGRANTPRGAGRGYTGSCRTAVYRTLSPAAELSLPVTQSRVELSAVATHPHQTLLLSYSSFVGELTRTFLRLEGTFSEWKKACISYATPR